MAGYVYAICSQTGHGEGQPSVGLLAVAAPSGGHHNKYHCKIIDKK